MLNSIIAGIVELRLFILVSAVLTLLLGMVLWIGCSRFSWAGRKRKLFGLFYGMKVRDDLLLVSALLKMSLFLAIVCDGGRFSVAHIYLLILLQLFSVGCRFTIRRFLIRIVETLVYSGVLLVMGILNDYLQKILFDERIFVVVILLGVLLVLYAALDIAHCCNDIVTLNKGQVDANETRAKAQ